MTSRAHLNPILNDDRLTRGLDDPEARLLIEWLVEQIESGLSDDGNEAARLCRRARAIARFVSLWCHERSPAAALQLAATERFDWPLPTEAMDACDLMYDILTWEGG